MQLALTATIPDVAFKTRRFKVKVEVLYDPFPNEFYRHYKIGKSVRRRYDYFDMMADHAHIMKGMESLKRDKAVAKCLPLFVAARDYYRSRCRRRRVRDSTYKFRSIVRSFISRLDKKPMYDIPFAYMPFWNRVQEESERRAKAMDIKREGYIPLWPILPGQFKRQ